MGVQVRVGVGVGYSWAVHLESGGGGSSSSASGDSYAGWGGILCSPSVKEKQYSDHMLVQSSVKSQIKWPELNSFHAPGKIMNRNHNQAVYKRYERKQICVQQFQNGC